MEIERKFLIQKLEELPFSPFNHPHKELEQGYLCTAPVVRIRREDDDYVLTYKSKGLMAREEYNLPLTKESYEHLKEKVDGRIIHKTRYVIPMSCVCPENADFCSTPLFLELDIFHDDLAPLILAEIEFPDEETANTYPAPQWLGEDVTFSSAYHNSTLSHMKHKSQDSYHVWYLLWLFLLYFQNPMKQIQINLPYGSSSQLPASLLPSAHTPPRSSHL